MLRYEREMWMKVVKKGLRNSEDIRWNFELVELVSQSLLRVSKVGLGVAWLHQYSA